MQYTIEVDYRRGLRRGTETVTVKADDEAEARNRAWLTTAARHPGAKIGAARHISTS